MSVSVFVIFMQYRDIFVGIISHEKLVFLVHGNPVIDVEKENFILDFEWLDFLYKNYWYFLKFKDKYIMIEIYTCPHD